MEKKAIGNVNILDLRQATEASVAEVGRIGNANILLYSSETAGLAARLTIGNINASVEVPAGMDAKPIIGQAVFNRDYFKGLQAPLYLCVVGQLFAEPDVPVEEVEKGLGGLVVVGQVICPERLMGVVQSKTVHIVGQIKAYPPLDRVHTGSLVLDEDYLRALDDGTELAVLGSMRVSKVLPNDLLERKIGKLFVLSSISCPEENTPTIQSRLVDGSGKVKVIPAGFALVQRPLLLDSALLESLPSKKLYCTERVQVAADVEASALDRHLEAMISEEMVLCPVGLKGVLAKKCDPLETRVVFYEGELWVVDGTADLPASRFDYLEGKATLVVLGALKIDPAIDPQVLAGRLAKVHNLGAVQCTPAQVGAIQSRLGLSDGAIGESTVEDEAAGERIGNANYLAL